VRRPLCGVICLVSIGLAGCGGSDQPSAPPLRVKAANVEAALASNGLESVECSNGRPSGLGNPWRCRARRPGETLVYSIRVDVGGAYEGRLLESTPDRPSKGVQTVTTADGEVIVGEFNRGETVFGDGIPVD
jgi:hypothetical protein